MASPRVVIAAPLYNKARYLGEAIESLLAQSERDFVLLLIDDRSEDETVAVARGYAERDPRVVVHVNPRRLGMLANTRQAFALARERYPDAPYWALASDHDRWRPGFLARLVGVLDADPEVVVAYGDQLAIDEAGRPYPDQPHPRVRLDTRGVAGPAARLAAAFRGMAAGSLVYGLFRARTLDAIGHYRPVLVPDRLLLAEVALRGAVAPVPEVLWERRFRGLATMERQRAALWPDGAPAHARLPWTLQHAGALVLVYALRAEGRPAGITRAGGGLLAAEYLWLALERRAGRRAERVSRSARRRAKTAWVAARRTQRAAKRARRRAVRRYGPPAGSALRRAAHPVAGRRRDAQDEEAPRR